MASESATNIKQAVPFFMVSDIEASVRFYSDGLGFTMTKTWTPEGNLPWCWLERDSVALMLQEFTSEGRAASSPDSKLGAGVSICFICEDALAIYHQAKSRGVEASRPFVGWHVGNVRRRP